MTFSERFTISLTQKHNTVKQGLHEICRASLVLLMKYGLCFQCVFNIDLTEEEKTQRENAKNPLPEGESDLDLKGVAVLTVADG